MIKCKTCNGQKHYVGMGGMREKCRECKGVGFLADSTSDKKDSKKGKKEGGE